MSNKKNYNYSEKWKNMMVNFFSKSNFRQSEIYQNHTYFYLGGLKDIK